MNHQAAAPDFWNNKELVAVNPLEDDLGTALFPLEALATQLAKSSDDDVTAAGRLVMGLVVDARAALGRITLALEEFAGGRLEVARKARENWIPWEAARPILGVRLAPGTPRPGDEEGQ